MVKAQRKGQRTPDATMTVVFYLTPAEMKKAKAKAKALGYTTTGDNKVDGDVRWWAFALIDERLKG